MDLLVNLILTEAEQLKMWNTLKIFFTVLTFTRTDAQMMSRHKFKKHFVVKSTWSTPQWTNNAKRFKYSGSPLMLSLIMLSFG